MSDSNQRGFTVPELAAGISIASILFLGFLIAITNYFILITKNNAATDMATTSQNLLRSTVENLRVGDGVRVSNTINDPHAPAGGWNTNNTSFVIVIHTPALNSSHNYIIDPATGEPYMNELVYYKNGSTLMERVLANPNASGNILTTTCPIGQTSPGCPPDKTLADYLQSISFTFYDQNGANTTDPLLARSIKIDLTMWRNLYGSPITISNSIRATLRNRF